jgi:hypothetical protein
MAATLMMVALMASRRMNLEKVRWRLKAIRRAIKEATFKWRIFYVAAEGRLLIGKNRVISFNRADPALLKFFNMKTFFFLLVIPVLGLAFGADAQPVSDMVVSPSIGSPQLYPAGNQ